MSSSESEGEPLVTIAELRALKKKDLQEKLRRYNLPHSAPNKEILAKRLFRHLLQVDSSEESDVCDEEDDEPGQVLIPEANTLQEWVVAETEHVPNLQAKDVDTFYAFHKHPVTGVTLNFNNMQKKARRLSNEHYIREVRHHPITANSSYCYFKSKCRASMKNTIYSVTVCINRDIGSVQSAYCTCPAGKSEVCCHSGALMYHLVNIRNACTSRGCQWVQPDDKRQEEPKQFCNIIIANTAKQTDTPTKKPYPGVYKAGPCTDPDQFYIDLIAGLGDVNPECVLYKTMCDTIPDIKPFSNVYDPLFSYADSVSLADKCDELADYVDRLELSYELCSMLEKATKGQHANTLWREARSVLITASNFGSVVKRKDDTPPDNLVKKLRGYVVQKDTKAMSFGRRMEAKAFKKYAQHHMEKCNTMVTTTTKGLQVNPAYPFLGASVDGIVTCPKCGKGVIEIKCPYKWRKSTPSEACKIDSKFCCALESDGAVKLRANHNYKFQIMGQMAVAGVKWGDFVVWTKKEIHVERVEFDVELWKFMLEKLQAFYVYGMAAEIHSSRVRRGKCLYPAPVVEEEEDKEEEDDHLGDTPTDSDVDRERFDAARRLYAASTSEEEFWGFD